ncbi:MAG: ABC transporter permease [Chloroflexota bacterium]|nr:ABC transporter permease [Chloroflexota bacterium]
MTEASAILAIAHRDFIKLLRDRARIISSFAFPLIFIGVLGSSLQSGFGNQAGTNLLVFVFTGVLGMTIWQSTAQGIMSLIADREEDFSQEIFVSPISRYSIIVGKILGESLVALPQAAGILAFALVLRIPLSLDQLVRIVPALVVVAVFGGAFGVIVLANLGSQRAAQQIFPFVLLPQYFLAGLFNPIGNLPLPLDILSKISPLRYAVDLTRDAYYSTTGERVELFDATTNLAIIGAMFVVFMVVGTFLFVRAERNR